MTQAQDGRADAAAPQEWYKHGRADLKHLGKVPQPQHQWKTVGPMPQVALELGQGRALGEVDRAPEMNDGNSLVNETGEDGFTPITVVKDPKEAMYIMNGMNGMPPKILHVTHKEQFRHHGDGMATHTVEQFTTNMSQGVMTKTTMVKSGPVE